MIMKGEAVAGAVLAVSSQGKGEDFWCLVGCEALSSGELTRYYVTGIYHFLYRSLVRCGAYGVVWFLLSHLTS